MSTLPAPAPTYDKNGNQTNLTATSGLIAWNAFNQPIKFNNTINATYDALGRMVETGSGSTYQQFVFRPSGAMLAVYNAGTSSLVKGTIPLPGGETAIYNSGGLSYIRHTDWLGSSRFSTKWDHSVYAKESYAPFGETYGETTQTDRSFTGQDQDVVSGSGGTGVYDFLYRKQDPSAGRWLSPDPAGWSAVDITNPQSLNRYSYVINGPLNLIDLNGLIYYCRPLALFQPPTEVQGGADNSNSITVWAGSDPQAVVCDYDPDYGIPNQPLLQFQPSSYSPGGAPSNKLPWQTKLNIALSVIAGPLPSCHTLDNIGDVVGGVGEVGVIVTSAAIVLGIATGPGEVVIAPPLAIADGVSGILWAGGGLMNTAAKHGVGCWR